MDAEILCEARTKSIAVDQRIHQLGDFRLCRAFGEQAQRLGPAAAGAKFQVHERQLIGQIGMDVTQFMAGVEDSCFEGLTGFQTQHQHIKCGRKCSSQPPSPGPLHCVENPVWHSESKDAETGACNQ